MMLIIFLTLYGIGFVLCRKRMLPVMALRLYFTVHLLLSLLMAWAVCRVVVFITKNKYMDKTLSEQWALRVCSFFFGGLVTASPHIHVEYMPGSLSFKDLKGQHNLCLCHTSFFDTLLFLKLVPYDYVVRIRSFLKSTLQDMPLFGFVARTCGHFPVYFTSTEASSFAVDKAKQAAVATQVEAYLQAGGSLSFFPEGVLNRTPEVLKEFRLGGFTTILQHKLPVYYCVTYGNHEVWNSSLRGIPGFPADVFVYVGKFEYDADKVDARSLSTAVRLEMQKHLDDMITLRKKRNCKPPYVTKPHLGSQNSPKLR